MIGSISRWVVCACLAHGAGATWLQPGAAAARERAAVDSAHPAPEGPLASARPADGLHRFVIRQMRDGDSTWTTAGTMMVTKATLAEPSGAVVRRVIVYDYGARGRVVDTTRSVAATLAPVAERTYKPSGIITLDFAGRVVTGAMGAATAPKAIRDSLTAPAFNSTDLDLIVRSLELREGLRARLPLYDPEFGGFRYATVEVERDRAARGAPSAGDVWVIVLHDTRVQSTYRVNGTTRALLGIHVSVPERHVTYDIAPEE